MRPAVVRIIWRNTFEFDGASIRRNKQDEAKATQAMLFKNLFTTETDCEREQAMKWYSVRAGRIL